MITAIEPLSHLLAICTLDLLAGTRADFDCFHTIQVMMLMLCYRAHASLSRIQLLSSAADKRFLSARVMTMWHSRRR